MSTTMTSRMIRLSLDELPNRRTACSHPGCGRPSTHRFLEGQRVRLVCREHKLAKPHPHG